MKVNISGLEINYLQLGKGKNNIVILHGWVGSLNDWMDIANRLKLNHKITLLDFPGLGQSDKPKDDWNVFDYAEFTSRFLERLKIKKSTLIGHSFGGRIAILLASRYPNLVNKIVLVDAAGMEIKSIKAKILGSGYLAPFKFVKYFVPKTVRVSLQSKDYKRAGEMRSIFVNVISQHLRQELPKIQVPTLIVWGKKDRILHINEAKMLNTGIINSKLVIIPEASHWPHKETPDTLIKIFREEGVC